MTADRIETSRVVAAPAADVFAVLCDPQGHVAIDSSGMLQGADGDPVSAAGGSFVVHVGREHGYRLEPVGEGTRVTSFYDWSDIAPQWREADIFPVVSEGALRATLGILDRTVRRGYPRG